MQQVKIEVIRTQYYTSEPNPDDKWDAGCSDAEVSIVSAYLVDSSVEYCWNSLPIEEHVEIGDTVYLVYAIYQTGDSFGTYGGQYELLAVHRDARQAYESKDRYLQVTDHTVPWNGYFDRLNYIEVIALTIEGVVTE